VWTKGGRRKYGTGSDATTHLALLAVHVDDLDLMAAADGDSIQRFAIRHPFQASLVVLL
jgi:hypothetical protein